MIEEVSSGDPGSSGGAGGCIPFNLITVVMALACFDGVLAFVAFSQVMRIHLRSQEAGWTRQKVLHLMIGSSNLGYFIFFVGTVFGHCKRWLCWSRMCGFIFMAYPKILFLAAYLLLISFWIDLCHQETDEEEDSSNETEEDSTVQTLLNYKNPNGDARTSHRRKWRCCSFQYIGTRQKIVITGVAVVSVLMLLFAALIWIGTWKNPIDSSSVSEVYMYLSSVAVLVLSGALSYYAIRLLLKLSKVRSERAAAEMWKVGGLAAVSVICFTSSALVALLRETPLFYSWNLRQMKGLKLTEHLILYYFIGLSVPSSFMLWVMRELPRQVTIPSHGGETVFTFVSYGSAPWHQPEQSSMNQVSSLYHSCS